MTARPKTLWAAVGPVLMAAAMAFDAGSLHVPTLVVIFLAAIMIQIGTNLCNDYYDHVKGADTSERLGPVRATQAGLIEPSQMKLSFIIVFAIAVCLGGYLVFRGGWPIVVIGVASIASGILYTAGPFPLGYIGLGELFVLVFFGPVAVGGTYYLQTGGINYEVIVAGLGPGLISTAILAVNNTRDFRTDKDAAKKTLVVRFGYTFGVCEYILCLTIACVIPLMLCVLSRSHYFCALTVLTLLPAICLIKTVCSHPNAETFNKVLADTGKLLMLFSVLFSVGWLI